MGLSDYLHPLESGWSVWKRCCARGAGFPADGVLRLASDECARSADQILALDEQLPALREAAIAACKGAGDPSLRKTLKQLVAKKLPSVSGPPALVEAVAALADAQRRRDEEAARLQNHLVAENVRAGRILREVAAEPRFREALHWQNPAAVASALDSLQGVAPGVTNHDTRKRELLIASYLQRYSLKNESIGFFGPYGWGWLDDDGPALTVRPGAQLLASRSVYFEHWPMAQLAERLGEDEAVRDGSRPRLHPMARLDGTSLVRAGRVQEVPLAFARAAAACNGETPLLQIIERLLADPELELSQPDEALDLLMQLAEHRVILMALELPATPTRPDRALRGVLESLGAAGQPGIAALDRLEAARARLAQAGDEAERTAAIQSLERCFAEETGSAPTRNAGVTYGARTTVYEDCRRDLELRLGPSLVARVAPALTLLLESARWFSHAVARRYRAAFAEAHRECGGGVVDYADFARRADPLFTDDVKKVHPLVAAVADELRTTWAELLAPEEGARLVQRSSRQLRDGVAAKLAAPGPGFPSAREHCPDLLIACPSAEALARGEGLFVLGELHVALNTLVVPCCMQQAADPEELVRAHERDLPRPRVAPVMPLDARNRAVLVSPSRHDLDVENGVTRSFRPRS
jgi:hypothetical protein